MAPFLQTVTLAIALSITVVGGKADAQGDTGRRQGIPAERLEVMGIRIGSRESEVRQRLGAPTDSTRPAYSGLYDDSLSMWRYPGIEVMFTGRHVVRVTCAARRCRTGAGVGVGSLRAAVLEVYGLGRRLPDGRADMLVYDPSPHFDCWLAFTFTDGRVSEVSLGCDYS